MECECRKHSSEDGENSCGSLFIQRLSTSLEAQEKLLGSVRGNQIFPEEQVQQAVHDAQRQQRRRSQVQKELVEGETGGGSDEDVGWIADERRRSADVRGEDFSENERFRVEVQSLAHGEGHGTDEEHRGDVVKESGDECCEGCQRHEEPPGMPLAQCDGGDGGTLDEPCFLDDSHEDHHADEQADGIEINEAKGVFLGDQPEKEHSRKSRHRRFQPMHLFADDEREGRDEDDSRKPLLSVHDACPSWNAETKPRKKRQRWRCHPAVRIPLSGISPSVPRKKTERHFPSEKNLPATCWCVY